MTNFLVLKARAGITFIAFYQYGRQYNKEVQLPLEKKKKLSSKSLIARKLFSPTRYIPIEEREWDLVVTQLNKEGPPRTSFYNASWFHSVSIASDCTEGLAFLALQSLNLNIYA